MKHFKLFLACMLMLLFGFGQVWADDYSYTFTSKVFSANDDAKAYTLGDVSWNHTSSQVVASGKSAYWGYDATKGQQWGSGNAQASVTLSTDGISGTISQVVINASIGNSGSATLSVSVGGVDFECNDATSVNTTNAATAYTFEGSGSGTITITYNSAVKKAIYMKSIAVTYSTGGGSEPIVNVSPTSYDFGTVHASDAASKVFSVSGSNLTAGDLTLTVPAGFSVSPSSIAVDGTLAATNVTVSKNTSTEDDYAGNLEITGGGLESAKTVALTMTVDADPAPTGTFELYSGDITEGDYVLVSTNALSNTVNSNRLASQVVTISADKIVNPDAAIIWHIAPVTATSYWTVYNEAATKYAGGTTTKNQGALLSDITDYAKWTITEGTGVYEFENLGRANGGSDTGNKWLRYNSGNAENSRWACYGSGTGSAPALYKKSNGKSAAGLAYDAADAQKLVKVGGTLTAPTLTNPNTLAVTYASSDEAIVKVNASTGEITEVVAAGKAVITASTVGDATHNPGSASYTIFVAEQAGTESDPLSEANAKTLIDDGCTLTAHVNGVIATATYNSTYYNYAVTLSNGFQFYRLKDLSNANFSSDYLSAGDEVTAVGPLAKYSTTYQLGEGCYLTFYEAATTPLTHIANDVDHPYTVAQALEYAAAPTTYDLSDLVYVRGKVAIASTALFSSKYLTYSISDDGTTTSVLKVYNGLGISGVDFTSKDDILVGEVVVVKGNLTQYNTELELAANNELVSKKPVATIAIDNMAMEYGDVATISATITPAAAASTIVYNIKAGSDDVITLAGDEITAKSVTGTATIVATIAGTDDYEGATKEFTVSVSEGDTRKKATLTSFATGGVFDVTDMIYAAYQGNAANPVYISSTGDEMRLYKPGAGKTTGGYIVINAVKGCTIDEVIVYNGSAKATTIGCSTTSTLATSGEVYAKSSSVSFESLDATVVYIDNIGSDRMDIKKIEVFYTGDAAAVDHYELGGTYQTEFEIDDAFNHEGLEVFMAYDAGGTEKLEITPACTFSEPDMSVAGTPTVNITFAGGVVKTYDITVAASTLLDPELSYDPTSVTLTQGDALSAPTLNNPHTLDLTFNSNKTSVATVDEFGVIALAGGTGTATITASFAGDATYQAGNATFTITVNEPEEDLTGTWEFATSVAAGDRIIIASIADAGDVTTMGAQNGNNRSGVASNVAGTKLTPAAGTKSVTLVDAGEGKFALQLNNGSYLYASSNSGNQLKETAAYADNENAKWTISISEGVATITAQGTNSHNLMRFNPNSGSPLFNCYTSSSTTGTLVTVYKKEVVTPTPDYTRTEMLGAGVLGTICVDHNVTSAEGATFYEVSGFNGSQLVLAEVAGELEAGKPYVFQATGNVLNLYYGSTSVTEPDNSGALKGTFSATTIENTDPNWASIYYFANHALYSCSDLTSLNLPANRAYLVMSQVGGFSPMPGRRYITLDVNGQQTTTGVENLENGETPVKVIIDGQMFILRGEKLYDATGRLVK